MEIEMVNYGSTSFLPQNYTNNITEEENNLLVLNTQNNQSIEESQIEVTEENFNKEEVSWGEAFSLIGEGITDKVKSMATSVVKHPIATIATVGLTSAAIAAAPLIGVSSAVAGSVLAIGYAGYAIFNTGKDIIETIEDNNAGRYDEVRDDLKEIGGDTVDLALSLPFLPKAISTVKNAIKYAPKIGLNKTLISDLENGEGIYRSFKKAEINIQYETIGNQMGLEVKPELKFTNVKEGMLAEYEPTTATLKISDSYLDPIGNFKNTVLTKTDSSTVIAHELTHYKQFLEIAKANGVEGLQTTLTEYYNTALKENGARTTSPDADWRTYNQKYTKENILDTQDDIYSAIKKGLEAKTPEEKTYWNNAYNKAMNKMEASNTELKLISYNQETYCDALKTLSSKGLDKYIIENMTNGDKSAFNADFYTRALDSISDYTTNATKANEYASAFIQKVKIDDATAEEILKKYNITDFMDAIFKSNDYKKAQLEIYKSNLLEAEAYAAQGAYSQSIIDPNAMTLTLATDAIFNEEIQTQQTVKTLYDKLEEICGEIKKYKNPLNWAYNMLSAE